MAKKGQKKVLTESFQLTRFDYLAIKTALQSTISTYRRRAKDEEERPSIRAMLAAEAEEMQEALDNLRDQYRERNKGELG
jgi:hypothetical protein